MHNEKYTGVYVYTQEEEPDRGNRRAKVNAIRKENALPVIISKAQFMEVQQIMKQRKHSGRKSNYLCSGLVYCECGAKMHGMTSKRKGHEYRYFTCSEHCGAPVIRMEEVDEAAYHYLHTLLSEENQDRIADALRLYQAGEGSRMTEFKQVLAKRIREKEEQYQSLMENLSSGILPKEVVSDIAERMQQIKEEIAVLEATEPPKDFTVEQIHSWLEALKVAPDDKAVRLLVSRIEVKQKTVFNIASTLKAVLCETGCGSWI